MKKHIVKIDLWDGDTKSPSVNRMAVSLVAEIEATSKKEAAEIARKMLESGEPVACTLVDHRMCNLRTK